MKYYQYTKFSDGVADRDMVMPSDDTLQPQGNELATVNGVTYVSTTDDAVLPAQPAQITVVAITPDAVLLQTIHNASPYVRMIDAMVVSKIREQYSADDEIKCLRIAPSEETVNWNAYVETCRDWGRQQKAIVGL
jgi:hypothetical protein